MQKYSSVILLIDCCDFLAIAVALRFTIVVFVVVTCRLVSPITLGVMWAFKWAVFFGVTLTPETEVRTVYATCWLHRVSLQ